MRRSCGRRCRHRRDAHQDPRRAEADGDDAAGAGTNTNFDNGLTPTTWGVEQYTISINLYAATTDLNVVTERVGIASQFLQNAYVNGEQAARSLDELSRNALFGAYFGGNTRVRTTFTSAGPTVAVDDIRGFQTRLRQWCPATGRQQQPDDGHHWLQCLFAHCCRGRIDERVDRAEWHIGRSDVLRQRLGIRWNGRQYRHCGQRIDDRPPVAARQHLADHGIRYVDMANLLDAVAKLRLNAVPEIDGAYNCYLDPVSSRQLFADPDFKQLFQGATSANQVFKKGMTNDFLGLRFIPTTEAFVQPHPTLPGLMIRRPMVCGQGALIEGDFAGIAATDVAPADSIITIVDGIAMVTREAIDRLQQIIAQSGTGSAAFVRLPTRPPIRRPSQPRPTPRTSAPLSSNTSAEAGRGANTAMPLGSVSPFRPTGTVSVSAGNVSSNTPLSGGGDSVVVTNATTALAYVRFGSDTTVNASTTDMPVLAGNRVILSINSLISYAAAISPSGSGSILFSRGDGSII